MTRSGEWVAITLILLVAAVLRCWDLGAVPPGLSHDEVANGLIAQSILEGQHAVYFTAAYGHEPLYQYVQAASVALIGHNWIGLRWPSVAFGLLGLAAIYAHTRQLFGQAVALPAILWASTSFWPLFYARVGLRAISLPFTAALAAHFLFRSLRCLRRDTHRRTADHLLAGLFVGLSLYTYMAARFLPFILAVFLIYRFLLAQAPPLAWSRLLVLVLVAALVAAPLLAWLATHPDAEFRVAEVREPLDRLLAGDASLVWHNLVANLGFFTFTGDPWPHQGIPGRAVFAEPIGGLLFCAGLLIAALRWRDPRHGFLLIWLAGALLPSILSSHAPPDLVSDAPSSIRDIMGLVTVFVFPALAIAEVSRWIKRRWRDSRHSALVARPLLLATVLVIPSLALTVRDYFVRWPLREDVRYFYQTGLTAVGRRLDTLGPAPNVAVAGLSVHTMDRPTLEFSTRMDAENIRLCDTRQTLVIPGGGGAVVLVPTIVPFDDQGHLRQRLARWAEVEAQPSFESYRVEDRTALHQHLRELETEAAQPDGTSLALPATFEGQLTLLGYEWLERPSGPGGFLSLLTYWRVQMPPPERIKTFVHLLDAQGDLIVQDDGLESPPQGWAEGDLIVQHHLLQQAPESPEGLYTLQLGLYNPLSQSRLRVDGIDRLLLPSVDFRDS